MESNDNTEAATAQKLKMAGLLQRLHKMFRDYLPEVQTVIAALMLWTLIQSRENIEITKRQLEATIEPVVSVSTLNDKFTLTNDGSTSISRVEIVAQVGVYTDANLTKLLENGRLTTPSTSLAELLQPKHSVSIPLRELIFRLDTNPSPDVREVYCTVVRFRRLADLRPYYRFFYLMRADGPDGKGNIVEIYFPLQLVDGSISFGNSTGYSNAPVRRELREICLDNLSLPGLNDL